MATENKSGVRSQESEGGTVIFYITNNGSELAKKLGESLPDSEIIKYSPELFARKWKDAKNIVCIMATGIVVRAAARLLRDKKTDPAIVVLDEKGTYAISLLSGHLGGANELARKIADGLGGQPVITTASDVQGKISLDLWAREKNLYVEDFDKLKKLSAKIVNGKKIRVHSDVGISAAQVPDEFDLIDNAAGADLIISHTLLNSQALFLRPKNLVAGIGCNRGTQKQEIQEAVEEVLQREGLSFHSVESLATIDLKKNEKGLLAFARENTLTLAFYPKETLHKAAEKYGMKKSKAVQAATGAAAVAEPAALLSAQKLSDNCSLILNKQKRGNVTLAIAKAEFTL